MSVLVDVVKKYEKKKNISLVLINADINDKDGEALDKGGKFLLDIGIKREFLLDMYHTALLKYSPQKVVPATFLVNRQGYIVFREIGARDDTVTRLEKHIQSLR